jgi:carbonic anhydrase-like protein
MMMTGFRFGTAINCIDGRTQEVVIDRMKQDFNIDGVDMVTFPGVDGIFSKEQRPEEMIKHMRSAVSISIEKHGSHVIAVVGHHDCAGNPGDKEHHYVHIRSAMHEVSSWNFPAQVVGFYVNEKREIEQVK